MGDYGLGEKLDIPQLRFYSFLGLGEGKQATQDIEKKYQEWKKYFGEPTSCSQVQSTLPRIRSLMNSKTEEAAGISNIKTTTGNVLVRAATVTGFITPGGIKQKNDQAKIDKTRKDIQSDIAGLNKVLDYYVNFYNLNCIDEATGEKAITANDIKAGTTANETLNKALAAPNDQLAANEKIPLWVWIAGGVAAIGIIALIAGKD